MTPEEKAREIAYSRHATDEAYAELIAAAIREAEAAVWSRMRDTVEATAREARNEALTVAAGVAKAYAESRTSGWPGKDQDEVCHAVAEDISSNILALMDAPD
jgi:hypothetical protein